MESASSSSSSGTTSTLANNTLTTSIPPTTNTTQTLSSMATSSSARTSSRTISGTTSTTATNTTSSDQSIISSSTATTTTTTTTSSTSSASTSTTSSTTSASTSSTTTLSSFSSSSSSSTLISTTPTTPTTSSSSSTTSTTSSSSSLTPIVLPKTTTSTDGSALTPTPTATAATVITTVLTSTGSNGTVVTITQVQVNPTLSPNYNGDSVNSTFFSNTGAVAGTFILVGLTVASILLWTLFYVRRRRRRRQLEHESAVSATLAAAGLYRSPLDDDDLQDGAKQSPSPDVDMNQRSGSRVGIATMNSQPSNGRLSALYDGPDPEGEAQNPLSEFGVSRRDGYMPARTSSPDAHYTRDRQGSTSTGGFVKGHSANQSVGSYEPLLASYNRPSNPSPPSPTVPLQPLAPIASQDATTTAGPSTDKPLESTDIHNSEDTDGRLDPNIRQRLEHGGDNASARELRDEEDYSRPVLQVSCRDLPMSSVPIHPSCRSAISQIQLVENLELHTTSL
ncbi:hypothetical protein M378DRAFT_495504 [Amanita muscaria Koide BX008]|uniref:Uncharacterized protein n=1 Tax=Amanita muscaria (strain Koide BX008) TaxID=946122 RepID=A0A0C2XNV6_AMAMK|nr:hypothetical protein M378DRAFT_495504 [Amanita muscaria Koide BX008]